MSYFTDSLYTYKVITCDNVNRVFQPTSSFDEMPVGGNSNMSANNPFDSTPLPTAASRSNIAVRAKASSIAFDYQVSLNFKC